MTLPVLPEPCDRCGRRHKSDDRRDRCAALMRGETPEVGARPAAPRPVSAKPTAWRGINFRSKLEATWAAFFEVRGQLWRYEPFTVGGYTPDFALGENRHDPSAGCPIIEVKPASDAVRLEEAGPQVERSDYGGPAMLVGAKPVILDRMGDACWGLRADRPSWVWRVMPVDPAERDRLLAAWSDARELIRNEARAVPLEDGPRPLSESFDAPEWTRTHHEYAWLQDQFRLSDDNPEKQRRIRERMRALQHHGSDVDGDAVRRRLAEMASEYGIRFDPEAEARRESLPARRDGPLPRRPGESLEQYRERAARALEESR